ncbi:hypothetical protein [Myxococcus sp. RHSTA-1-4]|uniref:hypothetical protein n=1 Tax=Myxococcus sp. RHSTA-1-4 TaxID=2874601 RepID=UPI001CC01620|nr:hypothetical protein [Myxococcus sp. RHSTA-1-4]MBZ4417437.1 hypothetical protein [Myxococcus sp. RHSTA-1-4]
MPIALLLHPVAGALWRGVHGVQGGLGLSAWVELVRLEEVLIGRAQGAFLVRWFGPRLPLRGGHLRVVLVNLEALRERFLAIQRARVRETPGLNLEEPLAGFTGIAAGLALSPTGVLLLVAFLLRNLPGWFAAVVGAIAGVLVGVLVGGLVLGAGVLDLPLALLGLPAAGALRPDWLRKYGLVHEALGAAARLMEAFLGFVDVLLGPREQVRNPILRGILEVFDALARFVPFVMAAAAVLIVYVAGNTLKLARQAVALLEVKDAVLESVALVVSNTSETLAGMLSGPGSPFEGLRLTLTAIGRALAAVGRQLSGLVEQVSTTFVRFAESSGARLGGYGEQLHGFFSAAFETHPLGRVMTSFLHQVEVIQEALSQLPPKPSKPPEPPSEGGWLFPEWLLAPPPPMPPPPKLPKPADIAARMGGLPRIELEKLKPREGLYNVFDTLRGRRPFIGPQGLAELEVARDIHGVLGRERREQVRKAGVELARARARETALREVMVGVVETVLPPAFHAYVPTLREVFEALDENLYGGKTYPVKTPRDSGKLRPVVHRLHLRHPDGATAEVTGFRTLLLQRLGEQRYLAPGEV